MSEDKQSQFIFIWKIKNCLTCNSWKISSPVFAVDFLVVQEWYLDFYLNKYSDEKKKYTECYLSRKKPDSVTQTVTLNYEIEFLDLNDKVLDSKSETAKEFKANETWGWDMLEIDQLYEKMKTWSEDTLTIRCTITSHEYAEKPLKTECNGLTIMEVDLGVSKWNLSNFGFLNTSEDVTLPYLDSSDLKISLSAPEENVVVNIKMLRKKLLNELIKIKLTFLSEMWGEIATKCDVHTFESMEPWQYPTFVTKEDLKITNAASNRNKCTFICEYAVARGNIATSTIHGYIHILDFNEEVHSKPKSRNSLLDDFQKLYISKKFSDVKLRVENKEFPAHKAVLAVRSPVFSTMFEQEMLETQTGIVDIQDMDGNTLQRLMEFIYTGTMKDLDCKSALKLLLAADRYQVQSLVEECSSMVLGCLDIENVCEVIAVADMINHDSLKRLVLKFMFYNVPKVLETTKWSELIENKAKLASEILSKLSKNLKHKKQLEDK